MSRLHEDWVRDNILHDWPERITFSIPEAIETLDAEFEVLSTSPVFVQDWRWYKSIPRLAHSWNQAVLSEHQRWGPYFLDYRIRPEHPCETGDALDALCLSALKVANRIWRGDLQSTPEFAGCLHRVRDLVAPEMPGTAGSIDAYLLALGALQAGHSKREFGDFRPWFGRGQQYLSFVRKTQP
jgi:hypothetical protein